MYTFEMYQIVFTLFFCPGAYAPYNLEPISCIIYKHDESISLIGTILLTPRARSSSGDEGGEEGGKARGHNSHV